MSFLRKKLKMPKYTLCGAEYVYEAADILGADRSLIHFGERAKPFIFLRPSVLKLKRDTGFEPKVTFKDSICLKNWKN